MRVSGGADVMGLTGVVVFLPCRAGSTRVPEKNTRPFAGHGGGLLGVKLDQLERLAQGAPELSRVVVDSNDPVVLERARARQATWAGRAPLVVVERPDVLGQSATTTDALIGWALDTQVASDAHGPPAEHLMWTHVTSPMADEGVYRRVLDAYAGRDPEAHDSAMTTLTIRGFLWSDDGTPLSYRRGGDGPRWPRTQDIAPVHEIDSAAFIVPADVGLRTRDRIGDRPLCVPMGKLESVDVDWEEDFRLAELVFQTRER